MAISMRLNKRRRTAVATATRLPRYAWNDKVGTRYCQHPREVDVRYAPVRQIADDAWDGDAKARTNNRTPNLGRLELTMAFAHPEFLVSTDWLAERLADNDVRVFETTVFLHPRDGGGHRVESGRREYESGHIPGAGFLDLPADFSGNDQPWRFMMPSAGAFAEATGRHGISESSKFVLYDRLGSQWAARLWWMFRSMGCTGAVVRDGGFPRRGNIHPQASG